MLKTQRHILLVLFALLLGSTLSIGASLTTNAASIQHSSANQKGNQKIIPFWTGGGCSSFSTYGPTSSNVMYQSCIDGNTNIPNDNATFTYTAANPNLWSTCAISVRLRDDTVGTTVTSQDYNCLPDARANVSRRNYSPPHIAATSGHKYHTYTFWNGTYNGTFINGGTVNSPELFG